VVLAEIPYHSRRPLSVATPVAVGFYCLAHGIWGWARIWRWYRAILRVLEVHETKQIRQVFAFTFVLDVVPVHGYMLVPSSAHPRTRASLSQIGSTTTSTLVRFVFYRNNGAINPKQLLPLTISRNLLKLQKLNILTFRLKV